MAMGKQAEQTAYAIRMDEFVLGGILGLLCADVLDGNYYRLSDFLTRRCGASLEQFSFAWF